MRGLDQIIAVNKQPSPETQRAIEHEQLIALRWLARDMIHIISYPSKSEWDLLVKQAKRALE